MSNLHRGGSATDQPVKSVAIARLNGMESERPHAVTAAVTTGGAVRLVVWHVGRDASTVTRERFQVVGEASEVALTTASAHMIMGRHRRLGGSFGGWLRRDRPGLAWWRAAGRGCCRDTQGRHNRPTDRRPGRDRNWKGGAVARHPHLERAPRSIRRGQLRGIARTHRRSGAVWAPKGAFTGADRSSAGLFRAAHGGTIFLDEILDLPPGLQPKLLRALERHEVLPLGETVPVPIDVRFIAATQESLSGAVENERFRADLRARLDGLTVVVPPLRDRREDIAPLFGLFTDNHAAGRRQEVEPRLIEALCQYDWPLNVREVLLLARRLLAIHGEEQVLRRSHLPDRISAPRADKNEVRGAARPRPAERSESVRPDIGRL